jgi:type IV secretory pathway TraG/TraD family ATPase VirD4
VISTLVPLALVALAPYVARRAFAKRAWWWFAGAAAAGALAVWILYQNLGLTTFLIAAGLGLTAAATVWHRRTNSRSTVNRWGERTRRTAGVATTYDIIRVGSGHAMRRKAKVVRPSLRSKSRRQIMQVPTREFAIRLAKVGLLWLYASIEDVVTIFGGPRAGKTGMLIGLILDAPGAVITTSTRTELLEQTKARREQGGRLADIYNPAGLGDLKSTVGFDPLMGCKDALTAIVRAADMIPEAEGVSGDSRAWDGQARRVLAGLMHAAALGDLDMTDVYRWVSNPDAAKTEVMSLIRRSDQATFADDVYQFVTLNDKSRSSITMTMTPALQWLNSPAAEATTRGKQLDVEAFIKGRGTIYMLGRHEMHTAALLSALLGHIAREARRLAALQPKGRLDPPLSMYLDEAARIAPVPLPDWSGDAGGSGISIVALFQSRADLIDRWGPTGAAKVLNNSGSVMLFGGTKDPDDLSAWSKLAGEREEIVETLNAQGKVTSTTTRRTQVLSASQLANLPEFKAVIFRRGMPPAIGHAQMAWKRRDVKQPLWWRTARGVRSHAVRVASRPTSRLAPARPPVSPAVRERVADRIPATSHTPPAASHDAGDLVSNGHRHGGSN